MRPSELHAGRCYFAVNYADNDLLIPHIETLIYRDCATDEDGRRVWEFELPNEQQEESSHIRLGCCEDDLTRVLDWASLQATLAGLARLHGDVSRPSAPLGMAPSVATELRTRLQDFLKNVAQSHVTVTVAFLDVGFSYEKTDKGIDVHFYPGPPFDDTDQRILAFFEAIGSKPHTDYLANKGRTRILGFSVPKTLDGLTQLGVRLLTEVYRLRSDDCLRFDYLPRESKVT